jgi:hypothetical protein
MAVNRRHNRFLSAIAQSAQRVGQSRADGPLVDFPLDCRTEPRGQGQAACHPGFAPAEKMRNASQPQAVLLDQRTDHARFVHRGRGARRRIRAQQQEFLLGTAGGTLDHGRQDRSPFVLPERETLEAVDNLEESVAVRHHADRQVPDSGLRLPAWRLNAAQTFQTAAQPIDRDHGHQWQRIRLCWLGHIGRASHGCVR